ncbi:MAG: hypothetical protein ACHP85_03135, partial [Burkholderiales bacterium]
MTKTAASAISGSPVVSLGGWLLARGASVGDKVDFLGATLLAIGRLVRFRPRQARNRFVAALRDAGMGSLPIVAIMGLAAG